MNDKDVEALNNQLGRSQGAGTCGGVTALTSRGSMPKTLMVRLTPEKSYQTAGTDTWLVDVLDLPQLTFLGPMIKQMRVHWECVSATTNFQGRVTIIWSVSGRTWSSVASIFSQTGAGQAIGSWYSTDANFGAQMQYRIEVNNSTGSAIESGRLVAFLEIELKS